MSWRTVWQQWFGWLMRWIASSFAMSDVGGQIEPPSLPYRVTHAPVVVEPAPPSDRVCEVCGLTLSLFTARTFDGHWRCAAHKGVTCDECGRALPAPSLPDQAWRCAVHR